MIILHGIKLTILSSQILPNLMNPNFKFSKYQAHILSKATSSMIGEWPQIDPKTQEMIIYQSVMSIETQLRHFPWEHRLSFIFGLYFLEFGGFLGAWGILPFSLLKPKQAERRLKALFDSDFILSRLLIKGIKVLVCLSAFSHPDLEKHLGMERRKWRENRVAKRNQLVVITDAQPYMPTPKALKDQE
jgi:hypothetical protein